MLVVYKAPAQRPVFSVNPLLQCPPMNHFCLRTPVPSGLPGISGRCKTRCCVSRHRDTRCKVLRQVPSLWHTPGLKSVRKVLKSVRNQLEISFCQLWPRKRFKSQGKLPLGPMLALERHMLVTRIQPELSSGTCS